MRRRAAVEPVIGHLKDDHRMQCNYLKGRDGDRINAVLRRRLQLQPAPALV
jgi:IS5 family transposase